MRPGLVSPATVLAAFALIIACTGVTPAEALRAVQRAVFAQNSGAVNGIKASRTPRAGRLLPLGSDGKLDATVLPAFPRGPRGAQGPAGATGPQGPAGSIGPSSARIALGEPVTLSADRAVVSTIASLSNLAAGSYLVLFTADASYRAAGTRGYVACQTRVNGIPVSNTSAILGESNGATGALTLASNRSLSKTTPFDLSITCYQDQNPASVPGFVIGNQALVALKLDSITTS